MHKEANGHEGDPRNLAMVIANRIIRGTENSLSLFSSACIYRVPEDLRKLNESAYSPRLIAIGPLHSDDPHLPKTMQHVKRHYADYQFLRVAVGFGIKDVVDIGNKKFELLQECVEKMMECVDRARKYYAEEVKVKDNNEMAEMMLIDGCFILELLYASYRHKKIKEAQKSSTKGGDSDNSKASSRGGGQEGADAILDNILTANIVKEDLLLLENQIPFFVLDELFKLTMDKIPDDKIPGGKKLSLTEYVILYFADIMYPQGVNNAGSTSDCVLSVSSSKNEIEQGENGSRKANDYYHILHLIHNQCLPVPGCQVESGIKLSDLRISASDLDYAGVKLAGEKRSLFNITFEGGKFEIPNICIHGSTEVFLRNLIAFEQCCPWVSKHYFTSYAMFMDMLINSEKDVQVLKNANVIENYLGTDKVVFDLFNNLCKEIVTEDFYFSEVCQQAFDFTERSWWPMFSAYLKRTYFGSPWAFIGFCLAFIAFGMQVVQFIYGFLKC